MVRPHRVLVFAVVPALRRELTAYLLPPADNVMVRPVCQLAEAVAAASWLCHAVDLNRLGAELPGLLAELRSACQQTTGAEREQVFGLLAETYYAAGQLTSKLGYTDLESISVDRYEWAAERSGDELAVLVGAYRRAGDLICLDECGTARWLLDDARSRVEDICCTAITNGPSLLFSRPGGPRRSRPATLKSTRRSVLSPGPTGAALRPSPPSSADSASPPS